MCNLYHVSEKEEFERFLRKIGEDGWRVPDYGMRTVGPNQPGVYFRPDVDGMVGQVGQWGLIRPGQPERLAYLPSKVEGKRGRPISTNNARLETVATKPTYRAAWAARHRCLIPAAWYQEPNWETGKNIWWHLKRADGLPWMLAGLWSEWTDKATGEIVPNFTMLTVNCDWHPLLNRLHRPDPNLPLNAQDKRAVVHIEPENWDAWFNSGPEDAIKLLVPPHSDFFDQYEAKMIDERLEHLADGDTRPVPPQLF